MGGEGFALRTLLSACQVGGRVAWRRIAATALRRGLYAEVLAADRALHDPDHRAGPMLALGWKPVAESSR